MESLNLRFSSIWQATSCASSRIVGKVLVNCNFPYKGVYIVLENSILLVKVGLKFANESVEPAIEFPNIFLTLLANFEVLRINRGHTFHLTPSLHESIVSNLQGF
jgi:hypothetical protein